MPPVPPTAKVAVLMGYQGEALSTVAVAGQDEDTTVAFVRIEPGERPLYLFVAAARPVVWKFEGQTDRVANVVVEAKPVKHGQGAAVAGIPADRVSFVAANACVTKNLGEAFKVENVQKLGEKLGHLIHHYEHQSDLNGFHVPSGDPEKTKDYSAKGFMEEPVTFDFHGKRYRLDATGLTRLDQKATDRVPQEEQQAILRDMDWLYSEGVVEFDPEDLVSAFPLETYAVLPSTLGVLELIADGHLTNIPVDRRAGEMLTYQVRHPFARLPSGLAGPMAVRFRFPKGMPFPEGEIGHSILIMDGTLPWHRVP